MACFGDIFFANMGVGVVRIISMATRSTTTRDRNLQFRESFSTEFLNFLQWIFSFPGFMCKLAWKSPQNVEKIARFPGREKCAESCHVSGCHGFFGPDQRRNSNININSSGRMPAKRHPANGTFPGSKEADAGPYFTIGQFVERSLQNAGTHLVQLQVGDVNCRSISNIE